jgi:hypothetical protein
MEISREKGFLSRPGKKPFLFLWGGKICCALIATPNVDNANRRQKKGKKLNYKLRVILMQKGIVVFIFQTT